jgi:hypothetical protein
MRLIYACLLAVNVDLEESFVCSRTSKLFFGPHIRTFSVETHKNTFH